MKPKNFMVAIRPNSAMIKFAITAMIALSFALVCTSSTAYAKKKKVKYGELLVTTNPGGLAITIDGKPEGTTTTDVRTIPLDPGHHNVEITLPNGGRWVRDFDVERGRRLCLNVNYHPKTYTPPSRIPCPYPVFVTAPPSVNDGDLITFTSDVKYEGTGPLNYTWTVSPAKATIVSGAGTPTITIDSTGLGNQRVTATLVVDDGSGEAACRQTAQASTSIITKIIPPPECREFDKFQSVAFDDDKARFDNLAIELANAPDHVAYLIIYAAEGSKPGHADALGRRSTDYLTNTRGVDSRRVIPINGGYAHADYFEIWLCPPGAPAPQPTPNPQFDVQPTRERTAPRRRRGRED